MNEQIYLILILVFIILLLSRFIVRLYNTDNPKARGALFFFSYAARILNSHACFCYSRSDKG